MADAGPLLQRRRAGTPDELRPCEQQLLVEIVGRRRSRSPERRSTIATGSRRPPMPARAVRRRPSSQVRPRGRPSARAEHSCRARAAPGVRGRAAAGAPGRFRPARAAVSGPCTPRRTDAVSSSHLRPAATRAPRRRPATPRANARRRSLRASAALRRGFQGYPTSRLRPRSPRSLALAGRGRPRARHGPSGATRRGGSRSRPRAIPTPSATAARPPP